MLISTIIGHFLFNKIAPNFLCAKTLGILISISFTVIFFYTSGGIIGKNIAFLNILIFYVAVILSEYVSYKFIIHTSKYNKTFALVILITLFICFILFTYITTQIGLFKDPITSNYGIFASKKDVYNKTSFHNS